MMMSRSRMHSLSPSSFVILLLLVFSCCSKHEARDSITVTDPILNGSHETLVSDGSIFEFGIFTPEGSDNKYLGIWYYELLPRTVVWVAKRDGTPLNSCGWIRIRDDGNVEVKCSNEEVIPITNLPGSAGSNRTLQLLDSGNLVLRDADSGTTVWQSFDEPTDTFLYGMKWNDTALSSWISPSNPGTGNYSFKLDQGVYVISESSITPRWKSNEPDSFMKDIMPSSIEQMLSGNFTGNSTGNFTEIRYRNRTIGRNKPMFNYTWIGGNKPMFNYTSRLVMNSSGAIQYYNLTDDRNWSLMWSAPGNNCSVYNACGKFGVCNVSGTPMCTCPHGFNPVSSEDWKAGQYSEGCDRVPGECRQRRTFVDVMLTRVGGGFKPVYQPQKEGTCKDICLDSCNCQAYYFKDVSSRENGSITTRRCWIWMAEVENLHLGDDIDASDSIKLSLRISGVTAAEANQTKGPEAPNKNNSRRRYVIAITGLVAGIILLSCYAFILYRKRRVSQRPVYNRRSAATPEAFFAESERHMNNLMQENDKQIDVPFYDLDSVLSATDNFSDSNKLGQGGFGPVYKGRFPGGNEIAVKRLSSCSSQGIEEFLNEVVLIAKLQHRNLVRLLGYCIKGSEKILLYEYMPNRSLDAIIFDQDKCLLLDWKKRFDIILGIARGLLYLHQDSRLRIIHRDLKTSNILLDEDMNPKISDFGLARIVEGKGTEASTNKVVGTYGYMSPEYALDGKFSTKSDVFSFGVVMLEIISGRKNTGFYNPQEVLNLLGYTWSLWCDNKALDMIDSTLLESCEKSEVIKCINIGLLCVQEDPNDRPSMSTVVIMLVSETSPLPVPTQPAFVVRRRLSATSSSSSAKPDTVSVNELTFSTSKGR